MNLWHDIPLGSKAPEEINVIIETPKGSSNKYEIDKETGLIKLDRANYNGVPFPIEYGFIPRTYWEDGDAIDVILFSSFPVPTGVLVNARPVALMEMTDTGESDWKILAVPLKDKRWDDVGDLADLNQHILKEVKHFFETYKALKGAKVVVHGYKNRKEALETIKKGIKLYQEKFGRK